MRRRNYWLYSAGLVIAWAIVFVVAAIVGGEPKVRQLVPVCAGFVIGWISTTIARYVYPPPRKWRAEAAGSVSQVHGTHRL